MRAATASVRATSVFRIITAVALLFGGSSLQNQYTTTLKVHEELDELMRFADERYVEKDYLYTVSERVERIEEKIDALSNDQRGRRGGLRE